MFAKNAYSAFFAGTERPARGFMNPEFKNMAAISPDLAEIVFGIDTEHNLCIWNADINHFKPHLVDVGVRNGKDLPESMEEGGYTLKFTSNWVTGTEYRWTPKFLEWMEAYKKDLPSTDQPEQLIAALTAAINLGATLKAWPDLPVFEEIVLDALVSEMSEKHEEINDKILAEKATKAEEERKKADEEEAARQLVQQEGDTQDAGTTDDQPPANEMVEETTTTIPDGAIVLLKEDVALMAVISGIVRDALAAKDKPAKQKVIAEAGKLLRDVRMDENLVNILKAAMEAVQPNSSRNVRVFQPGNQIGDQPPANDTHEEMAP